MEAFINILNSPMIALLVLLVLLIEAAALGILWQTRRIGLPATVTVWFLGAGAAFSIALWVALSDGNPTTLAIALVVAFVCHVLDLRQRWQS